MLYPVELRVRGRRSDEAAFQSQAQAGVIRDRRVGFHRADLVATATGSGAKKRPEKCGKPVLGFVGPGGLGGSWHPVRCGMSRHRATLSMQEMR